MFYFPSSMTITLDGLTSCTGFGGYHNAMVVNGVTFAYAIMPECPVAAGGHHGRALQYVTLAASHELAEAATDPFSVRARGRPSSATTSTSTTPRPTPGTTVVGGEVGDMCFDDLGLGQDEDGRGGFTVQRIWSNAAAAAEQRPCVPALSRPYFNVAPEQWLGHRRRRQHGHVHRGHAFSSARRRRLDRLRLRPQRHVEREQSLPDDPGRRSGQSPRSSTALVGNGDKVTVSVTLHKDPGTALMEELRGGRGPPHLRQQREPQARHARPGDLAVRRGFGGRPDRRRVRGNRCRGEGRPGARSSRGPSSSRGGELLRDVPVVGLETGAPRW